MKFKETSIACHCSGDILLTRSKKVGTLIVLGQKHYYKKDSNYSHVAICVLPGVFAEATIGRKIECFYYKDQSHNLAETKNWKLLRNKIVAGDNSIQNEIVKWILYQIGKSYDLAGLLSPKKKSECVSSVDTPVAICSEFVATVYSQINNTLQCDLFNSPPNTLIPASFEELQGDKYPDWCEIEKKYLQDNFDHSRLQHSAQIWLKHQSFLNSLSLRCEKIMDWMSLLSEITLTVSNADDVELMQSFLSGFGAEPIDHTDVAFPYSVFSKFETYSKYNFEDYTPTNFNTKKSKTNAVAQANNIRERMLSCFAQFIKTQKTILETFEMHCSMVSEVNGKGITSEKSVRQLLLVFNAIVELLEQLPINNIEEHIDNLNKTMSEHAAHDEELVSLQNAFMTVLKKIEVFNTDNTVKKLKKIIQEVNYNEE
jgi:hypothetical protein